MNVSNYKYIPSVSFVNNLMDKVAQRKTHTRITVTTPHTIKNQNKCLLNLLKEDEDISVLTES